MDDIESKILEQVNDDAKTLKTLANEVHNHLTYAEIQRRIDLLELCIENLANLLMQGEYDKFLEIAFYSKLDGKNNQLTDALDKLTLKLRPTVVDRNKLGKPEELPLMDFMPEGEKGYELYQLGFESRTEAVHHDGVMNIWVAFHSKDYMNRLSKNLDPEIFINLKFSSCLAVFEEILHGLQNAKKFLQPMNVLDFPPRRLQKGISKKLKETTINDPKNSKLVEHDITFYLEEHGLKLDGTFWLKLHRKEYGDEKL